METSLILTIAPAPWSDEAAAMLATTIRGAPCYTVRDLGAEVMRGDATLYRVSAEDGRLVGFVVLRIELYEGGAEGVIVAGAGELAGARLYRQVVPALERLFTGVKSIRVESCRKAGTKALLELGYLPTHAIMRRVVQPLRGDDVLEALQHANTQALGGPDLRARPGKLHGGGGSSSSSSSQKTTSIDKRLVVDTGSTGISADRSTVTINTLDGGAIQKAFDFATASDQETGKTLHDVLGLAANVFDKAGSQIQAQTQLVATAYDTAKGQGSEKTILFAAGLAVVGIVAIKVLAK